MHNLPIIEILKVGLSGLVFLIAFLGYRLLRKEQEKEVPRDKILRTVLAFMLMCFIVALMVGGVELIKFVRGSSSGPETSELSNSLKEKDVIIASLHERIAKLETQEAALYEKQLTIQQKIDLGLYYTYPASEDRIEKRDSKKALEYLITALKVHDNDLNEPRKAEIVEGLVRIREKIAKEEDFMFLFRKIEEYRYGITKELDLAKVYWAFANSTNRNIAKRRQKSLEHFLKAASEFENNISDNDKADIITLIEVLKKNDTYMNDNGDKIIRGVEKNNKTKIRIYLEEWNTSRDG